MSEPVPEINVPTGASRFPGFEKWFAEIKASFGVSLLEFRGQMITLTQKYIDERKLVSSEDKRVPEWVTTPDHLAVVRDAAGYESWLGARASDGGPTPWALHLLGRALGFQNLSAPGYLVAITDAARNMTDLSIRDTDGQFAQFVIDRLKPRILEGFTPPENRRYADTVWTGSGPFPIRADRTRVFSGGSSSMAGIDSRLAAMFGSLGASYTAGGKGGERAEHIAARLGSVPALVTVTGGAVPTSGPVDITTSNMPGSADLRAYAGTLAGVRGTISYSATSAGFVFTRTADGPAVQVPTGTPFIPDAVVNRDATGILWMGKNNAPDEGGADVAIRLTNATFDWLAPFETRCLVLGHFIDTNTGLTSRARANVLAMNADAKARYGLLYIDVLAYITSSQVWADTGITPTAEDLAQQQSLNKPTSLSLDNGHLNAAAYDAIRDRLIRPRLTQLNWY